VALQPKKIGNPRHSRFNNSASDKACARPGWTTRCRSRPYNDNGINGRLRTWSAGCTRPRRTSCALQELKAPDDKVSGRRAPRHRLRRGVARPEELERRRRSSPAVPIRWRPAAAWQANADDVHSRYIEAAIGGLT
jgi:hypothetical protein